MSVLKRPFAPDKMEWRFGGGDSYQSPASPRAFAPTLGLLGGIMLGPLLWLARKAKKGQCDDVAWIHGSAWVADILEGVGGQIQIEGMDNLKALANSPCVIIGNHMSALETFLFPAIIRPHMPVTFVVKRSLTVMPLFGHVMRSRDPVVVDRVNPRADLATVLAEGSARLGGGVSVVVFPQHTRSLRFDPAQFNSIGVKLALKAGVPVLPVALKTDVWGQGKKIKELGRVRPELPARFRFGAPMTVTGRGKDEHAKISSFIEATLARWREEDGENIS